VEEKNAAIKLLLVPSRPGLRVLQVAGAQSLREDATLCFFEFQSEEKKSARVQTTGFRFLLRRRPAAAASGRRSKEEKKEQKEQFLAPLLLASSPALPSLAAPSVAPALDLTASSST